MATTRDYIPSTGWQPSTSRLRARRLVDRLMLVLVGLAILLVVVPLVLVLGWVLVQGLPALNLDFFTRLPGPPDDPHTGFANGIVALSYWWASPAW